MSASLSACGAAAAPTFAPAAPLRGAEQLAPSVAQATAASAPTAAPDTAKSAAGGANVPSNAAPINQKIIKNSQMTVIVDNANTAVARVTGIATDEGGYVVGSHTFAENNGTGAQITIAVPVDRFEEALNLVRKVAQRIDSDVTSTSDVTSQYVDLQSRLKNLQATADRIRAFLDKAATVDEALKVNQQLSDVESQIEQIKGQLNVMDARTSFSTITVDMHEPLPTPTPTATPTLTPTPTPIAWRPDQTFNSALTVQSSLLRGLGDLLIWVTVVFLPYLLFIVLIAGLVGWVLKRLGRAGVAQRVKTP